MKQIVRSMAIDGCFTQEKTKKELWEQRIIIIYDRGYGGYFIGSLHERKSPNGIPHYFVVGRIEYDRMSGVILSIKDDENANSLRAYTIFLDPEKITYNKQAQSGITLHGTQKLKGQLYSAENLLFKTRKPVVNEEGNPIAKLFYEQGQLTGLAQIDSYHEVTDHHSKIAIYNRSIMLTNALRRLPVARTVVSEVIQRNLSPYDNIIDIKKAPEKVKRISAF